MRPLSQCTSLLASADAGSGQGGEARRALPLVCHDMAMVVLFPLLAGWSTALGVMDSVDVAEMFSGMPADEVRFPEDVLDVVLGLVPIGALSSRTTLFADETCNRVTVDEV